MYLEPGPFIDVHKRMKAAAGVLPVMALGRIGTPDLADRVVRDGFGDLVGMTRAQITDAAFAEKARSGRAEEIRPCVFDNFCWGEIHQGKPLVEFHNVHLGEAGEADWTPEPADTARSVAVIGAGPAGLEAAWVAAARGHRVILFGASDHPGGSLRLEASLPGRYGMGQVIDHQYALARTHGVDLQFGQRATEAGILALAPDVVILTTGSTPRWPDGLERDGGAVMSGRAYLSGDRFSGRRGTAVLFDQDHTAATYGLADRLAEDFDRLILVTPRPHFAQAVNYCSAIGVHRRLRGAGVELIPAMRPSRLGNGRLDLQNVYAHRSRSIEDVDLLVYTTPRHVPDTDMWDLGGIAMHRVGDCRSPRNLMAAIHDGHLVALGL